MTQQSVYVAGGGGMVGSAILRRLQRTDEYRLSTTTRSELDLRDTRAVHSYLADQKPDWVVVAAAKVGGIHANSTYPADFIYDNLMIEANLIKGAFEAGVQKVLFLGSSCIYPKFATQPIPESELLNGALEPSNDSYAIAKILGIKLCEAFNRQHDTDYRSLMPTNLYGINDNFHPQNSHVIPALMRRFHEAKLASADEVVVWGSGTPMREFLNVDDLADAVAFVMGLSAAQFWAHVEPQQSHINLGTGVDVTIRELAEILKQVTRFSGELKFDAAQPDGTPRKLLDVSKLSELGWRSSTPLEAGLEATYKWFVETGGEFRT